MGILAKSLVTLGGSYALTVLLPIIIAAIRTAAIPEIFLMFFFIVLPPVIRIS